MPIAPFAIAADEVSVTGEDEFVAICRQAATNLGGKLVRQRLTRSVEFGLIWRADSEELWEGQVMTSRIVCWQQAGYEKNKGGFVVQTSPVTDDDIEPLMPLPDDDAKPH
jgi:hypothetical protein